MEEKDKQDKQDRERLLKRFKDRKPLDDNADSDIMAPPDVREAMSRRNEIAEILLRYMGWIEADKVADSIIALDKPTGVVELEQPSSFYFPLFHHLYEEYKLVLNDSELHEIYLICSKLRVKEL